MSCKKNQDKLTKLESFDTIKVVISMYVLLLTWWLLIASHRSLGQCPAWSPVCSICISPPWTREEVVAEEGGSNLSFMWAVQAVVGMLAPCNHNQHYDVLWVCYRNYFSGWNPELLSRLFRILLRACLAFFFSPRFIYSYLLLSQPPMHSAHKLGIHDIIGFHSQTLALSLSLSGSSQEYGQNFGFASANLSLEYWPHRKWAGSECTIA